MFRNLNLIATWFMFHTHILFPHESTACKTCPLYAHMGKSKELSRIYFPFWREPYHSKKNLVQNTCVDLNEYCKKIPLSNWNCTAGEKHTGSEKSALLMQILIRYSMQMSFLTKQQQYSRQQWQQKNDDIDNGNKKNIIKSRFPVFRIRCIEVVLVPHRMI